MSAPSWQVELGRISGLSLMMLRAQDRQNIVPAIRAYVEENYPGVEVSVQRSINTDEIVVTIRGVGPTPFIGGTRLLPAA